MKARRLYGVPFTDPRCVHSPPVRGVLVPHALPHLPTALAHRSSSHSHISSLSLSLSLSLTLTHVIFGIALIIAADDGRRDGCRRTFPPAITPSYPPSQFATASETLVAMRPSRSHSHPGRPRPLTSSCPLRRGDGGGGVGKTIKQRKSSTAKCLSAKTFPLASFALIAFLLQATLSR